MLKPLYYVCLFLICAFAHAQEKAQPPQIVQKWEQGKKLQYEDYQLKFEKVIEDSRCPVDVNCIRAGEAKVKIQIIDKNGEEHYKTLKIPRTAHAADIHLTVGGDTLQVYNLQPLPRSTTMAKKKE